MTCARVMPVILGRNESVAPLSKGKDSAIRLKLHDHVCSYKKHHLWIAVAKIKLLGIDGASIESVSAGTNQTFDGRIFFRNGEHSGVLDFWFAGHRTFPGFRDGEIPFRKFGNIDGGAGIGGNIDRKRKLAAGLFSQRVVIVPSRWEPCLRQMSGRPFPAGHQTWQNRRWWAGCRRMYFGKIYAG